eukprot:31499-Pelagococcus_subviridis.AAC.24
MSFTEEMPPSGMICFDSDIVFPACPGRESLSSITVGDTTPFAPRGTLTSSYTPGTVSLYVLKSKSFVPIGSASAARAAKGDDDGDDDDDITFTADGIASAHASDSAARLGSVVVVVGGGVDVAVVVASEASDAARGGTTASHRFIDRRAGVPTREEKAVDAVTVDIAGMDEMI